MNFGQLPATIESVLKCAWDLNSFQVQKSAFSTLHKMITIWLNPINTTQMGVFSNDFKGFVYKQVIPVCFELPIHQNWDSHDSLSLTVLGEVSNLHLDLYRFFSDDYLAYLTTIYLPTIGCPQLLIGSFSDAMIVTKDAKIFRKFLQVLFYFRIFRIGLTRLKENKNLLYKNFISPIR